MPQFPMRPDRAGVLERHPDYAVGISPSSDAVVVRRGDVIVAESQRALRIDESFHESVWYLPRDDVRMDLLERTDHSTYCPFKGHASYYSLVTESGTEENVVWTYEDPFEEVAGLKDYLAFYADRVEVTVG